MRSVLIVLVSLLGVGLTPSAVADSVHQTKGAFYDAFRQLDTDLPTPNSYRTASGAPGHEYWQQRADYDIEVTLDEQARRITASQTISYTNRSPDTLKYLWLQLDQNRFNPDSLDVRSQTAPAPEYFPDSPNTDVLTFGTLARHQTLADGNYGYTISRVADARGRALRYQIVDTMMRIELPSPLKPGARTSVALDYAFNIVNQPRAYARGGYEHFPDTDTYIYFMAQWFPRLAAYTDYAGWQHFAFLGRGEFALEFGDYRVAITVPADHIVSATGELTNPGRVLSATQQQRLRTAASADAPVFIVTPGEALANQASGTDATRTWVFEAENVRDFAFSSSRKFIWDAMGYQQTGGPDVMAMSFYPNEGEPIWSQYSTEAIVHTMEVYSRFSFPYPYPTSQSVNARKSGGMEYPMITSNGYRPEPYEPEEDDKTPSDKAEKPAAGETHPSVTYSRSVKYGLIGVIIHEVGHNYFPMIVNSDERQWTWMDEGLNSFLEYVAEFEWEENFPAYGEYANVLDYISGYMVTENQVPVMTQSDSVLQFGNNAYSKPTAALIVLRETVMGRELFDYAFREYANRWKFKRPTPADFFRTMEDASGMDLDWFWRGWFYSTDHVDIGISDVRYYQIATGNPDRDLPKARQQDARDRPEALTQIRNREAGLQPRLQRRPALRDFYNDNDRFAPSNKDRNDYQQQLKDLEDWERQTLERAIAEDQHIYFVDFENIGGLVMPLPLRITLASGAVQEQQLPAQIWRRSDRKVTRIMILPEPIVRIELDARHETADANYANNDYPRSMRRSQLALYKSEDEDRDLMANMLASLRKEQDSDGQAVPLTPSSTDVVEPVDAQQDK